MLLYVNEFAPISSGVGISSHDNNFKSIKTDWLW